MLAKTLHVPGILFLGSQQAKSWEDDWGFLAGHVDPESFRARLAEAKRSGDSLDSLVKVRRLKWQPFVLYWHMNVINVMIPGNAGPIARSPTVMRELERHMPVTLYLSWRSNLANETFVNLGPQELKISSYPLKDDRKAAWRKLADEKQVSLW